MKKAANRLTQGPVAAGLIAFSVPILISNLLQQVYNSVDSAILGRFVGSQALAAAGSVGALFNLLVGFSLGLAVGVNILYAIYYGAGDKQGIRRLIGNAFLLCFAAAALITAVGTLLADPLLKLVNTPEDVLLPSRQYLVIISAGVIVTIIYNVGAGMLRAEGDSMRPLIYLAAGGVLNLLLDLLFVVYLDFGIAGAAWATVLAQAMTAALVLIRLTRLDSEYALNRNSFCYDRATMVQLLRLSIPCGLQSSMFNISNLLVQAKVNSFGSVIMAGYTAYCKVDSFVYMPIFAFASAVSTFVGQNKGAGNIGRMHRGIRTGVLMTMAVTGVIALSLLTFLQPLMELFTDDPAAVSFGVRMSRYLMPVVAVYSISDVLGSAIRGFGQSAPVTAISVFCICLFRVVWLEALFMLGQDERIIFLCYPVSWMLCVAAVVWYYFRHSQVYKAIRTGGFES